ncbi:D-glycero-beta-D-manno-heptose-7-phosphate kinase [Xylophilus sp. GOD-11R]|uniref:D-glycero-beta-D-manno-heptose-7-phosphate kinase n=1 Tax=Xylophilus sp. GOD-11R TaxID=3089814 RepID=UPI00298CD76D|nr:D-glycero-beta-D-manno-heptose-7-phosphate kinase [Xylophilus sp. GOD-11R]WPB58504.1 D-glycero-beta-D-manno-heptose-7-phosphate kinase [Xylophilus sp. GOD-11R]
MTPTPREIAACRVLVAGDAILDRYWLGSVEHISREAPVPIVQVADEQERLGGAANAATNVRSLGASATLLSIRGRDADADRLAALVTQADIAWAGAHDDALPTTVKLRIVGRAQQLLRADFTRGLPSATALDTFAQAFTAALPRHAAVLLSDYGRGALARVPDLVAAARAAALPVVVDPRGGDFDRYAGATLLTPNRAELREAIGPWRDEADLADRVQALRHRLNLDAVLATRAEQGMTLFDADGALHVPATAREVFDVTGAGDTVAAVMATLLGCGLPMREAVPFANRAGGIVVGRFGTASVRYAELFA